MLSPCGRVLPLVVALTLAGTAWAQLAPVRTYFARDGRIEVDVRRPDVPPVGNDEGADALAMEIALLDHGARQVAVASVLPGRVDLSALFPVLWKPAEPSGPAVLYAQLRAGAKPVGAPLVLQPMVAPHSASPADPAGLTVRFSQAAAPYYSGLRIYIDQRVVLETSEGQIEMRLRPDAAPNTCWNFRQLVADGFYTNIAFHRIVAGDGPENGFVIQAGDPLGTGIGGPGYSIDLEPSQLPHDFGVVSMARLRQPDSGGSQFFICLSRRRCRSLDGAYAAFAQVTRGDDVVRAIARTPVTPDDRPLTPPVIRAARLVDAPPLVLAPEPPPAAPPAR